MDRVDTSGSELDLDIDLESGGTSDEDPSKVHRSSCEYSSNLLGGIRTGYTSLESPYGSDSDRDCSCPYEKSLSSNEISGNNKNGKAVSSMNKTINKEKAKNQNAVRPPKPPRPPKGPSLDACDMKLLKEISELNMKRKRMERIRSFKRKKKEKVSSLSSNLCALLVTVIFFLVIIFQGNILIYIWLGLVCFGVYLPTN